MARLPKLELKHAIIAMLAIGAIALMIMVFSAMLPTQRGGLDSFAVGEMNGFHSLTDVPSQPRAPLQVNSGGDTITLADKHGKVVLVNFWATWCAPCVLEMPHLDALQGALGSDAFEVVAISMDRTYEDAAEFYDRTEIEHLSLYFDTTMASAFDVSRSGLPFSILYDRQGIEVGRYYGEADWSSPEALALIEAAIERY